MPVLPIHIKSSEVREVMERLVMMSGKTSVGIAIRVKPQIAQSISRYSQIRRLNELDNVDITCKQHGKRRSLIYFPPNVSVGKIKEDLFFFKY